MTDKKVMRAPELSDILMLTSMASGNYADDGSVQSIKEMASFFPIAADIKKDVRIAHIVDLQTSAVHTMFLDQLLAHGIRPASFTFGRVEIETSANPESHQLLQLTDVSFHLCGVQFIFTVCNAHLAALRMQASVGSHTLIEGSVVRLFGEAALSDFDPSAPEMEVENVRSGREMRLLLIAAISNVLLKAHDVIEPDAGTDDGPSIEVAPMGVVGDTDDEAFDLDEEDEEEDDEEPAEPSNLRSFKPKQR